MPKWRLPLVLEALLPLRTRLQVGPSKTSLASTMFLAYLGWRICRA